MNGFVVDLFEQRFSKNSKGKSLVKHWKNIESLANYKLLISGTQQYKSRAKKIEKLLQNDQNSNDLWQLSCFCSIFCAIFLLLSNCNRKSPFDSLSNNRKENGTNVRRILKTFLIRLGNSTTDNNIRYFIFLIFGCRLFPSIFYAPRLTYCLSRTQFICPICLSQKN